MNDNLHFDRILRFLPLLCLGLLAAPVCAQRVVVDFRNSGYPPTDPDRLVYFDTVGGIRVSGTNYLAQLYYGTNADTLNPVVASPATFHPTDPTFAGTWFAGYRTLNGPLPGSTNLFQVKAWDGNAGSSFEDAFTNGGWVAQSDIFKQVTPSSLLVPLDNLRAFSGLAAPSLLSINDTLVIEGAKNTGIALFTVTLSPPSTQTLSVAYATANGTALAGTDYQATNGTVTFAPGETNKTLQVTVSADPPPDHDKYFFVNLSNPVGRAIVWAAQGQAIITRLRILSITAIPSSQPSRIRFITAPGQIYSLEKSGILPGNPWSGVPGATNVVGTGTPVTVTDSEPASQPKQFFRVRLVQ